MKVNQGNNGPIRPERSRDTRPTPGSQAGVLRSVTPAGNERLDRVEISEAGRARAAGSLSPVDGATAQRLAAIRQRVLEGAYNTDAVVADVARRILDRGDV